MLSKIQLQLLEVLRLGILEIRLVSARPSKDTERINEMANILHNVPIGIHEHGAFDTEQLKDSLWEYQ